MAPKVKEFKGSGVFFLGKGVVRHNGVDYKSGDELPADLPAETIEALKAKGKASSTKPVEAAAVVRDVNVAELQDKLAQATEAATRNAQEIERLQGELQKAQDGTARIAELEKNSIEREELIAKLQGDLTTAQTTIETLTAQLTTPPASDPAPGPEAAEGGAGPKK